MPLQEPSASSCVVPAYALRMLLGKPLCVEGVEQRLHGRRLPREDEIGRELGQRLERKAPLREAWMRHGQARLVQYDLTVDEQVEVDRPRPPPLAGAIATERLLYREENIEQRPWLEAGLELDDTVQVPRLLDLPPRVRLAEPRDRRDLDARIGPQQVDRPTDRRLPVAEVRSDADVRAHDRDGSDPSGRRSVTSA